MVCRWQEKKLGPYWNKGLTPEDGVRQAIWNNGTMGFDDQLHLQTFLGHHHSLWAMMYAGVLK